MPQRPVFSSKRMEQQWVRMQGVKMMRAGMPASHVAHHLDVSVRAVFKWIAAFYDGGQNALLAREGAGRPPKVTPEQLRWIADTVRDRTPDQLKFEFGLWTLRLIGSLIERQFQMTLSLPTLGKVMRQLGFTAQRPLYRAYQQDATLVQRWREEEYPALQARAKARGALIMFADEAGMRSDYYHAGTTWAPRGRTPVVRATGRRDSVQMLSAVGTGGQLQFMLHEGLVNATVFRSFLEQLMLGATQRIFLVVDGHSIHKAKLVSEYVASTDGMLELHFLPPYSPQLNPDEQVWKSVKERVAKQKPLDKISLRGLIQAALERLQNLPEIVRGFFRHPDCARTI
ncbi:MAG: IS630 family transposase [Candidatus Accumulibacter similis]|nr:MAG: IS630 family transposase [Candidatus Accumulibacter similis]